jgi:hypothetical protein
MNRGYTCLWRKIWSNPILAEPGKRFSRLEAWLYIVNVLAAEKDDPDAGLKPGEFIASIRQLAEYFNWSRMAVLRFFEILSEKSMIMRVGQKTGQEAGHFTICNYGTYNASRDARRDAQRSTFKEVFNNIYINNKYKDTHHTPMPADAGVPVSAKILPELYKQNNQALPEVKALTAERLRRCRSRINQAVRDGCLEQYLADFAAAVKKAQQTPFLCGGGARGWRASFDWFIANQVNVYAVLEGKYDSACAKFSACAEAKARRTSHGDPICIPRQ